MEKIELKELNIYKLRTIDEFHVESEIYIDGDNLYKIIDPHFILNRECIVEDLNECNIKGTIVPEKKIVMTNRKRKEMFMGYIMHYYKEYINLKKLLDNNSLTLEQRIVLIKKINAIYRTILAYGFMYVDPKLSNILVKEDDVLFGDMDSVKYLNVDLLPREKEKIFFSSLSLLLNINMRRDNLDNETKEYIKSLINSNYINGIVDNYFNNIENASFKDYIYLDNCLDSIKLNLIK